MSSAHNEQSILFAKLGGGVTARESCCKDAERLELELERRETASAIARALGFTRAVVAESSFAENIKKLMRIR